MEAKGDGRLGGDLAGIRMRDTVVELIEHDSNKRHLLTLGSHIIGSDAQPGAVSILVPYRGVRKNHCLLEVERESNGSVVAMYASDLCPDGSTVNVRVEAGKPRVSIHVGRAPDGRVRVFDGYFLVLRRDSKDIVRFEVQEHETKAPMLIRNPTKTCDLEPTLPYESVAGQVDGYTVALTCAPTVPLGDPETCAPTVPLGDPETCAPTVPLGDPETCAPTVPLNTTAHLNNACSPTVPLDDPNSYPPTAPEEQIQEKPSRETLTISTPSIRARRKSPTTAMPQSVFHRPLAVPSPSSHRRRSRKRVRGHRSTETSSASGSVPQKPPVQPTAPESESKPQSHVDSLAASHRARSGDAPSAESLELGPGRVAIWVTGNAGGWRRSLEKMGLVWKESHMAFYVDISRSLRNIMMRRIDGVLSTPLSQKKKKQTSTATTSKTTTSAPAVTKPKPSCPPAVDNLSSRTVAQLKSDLKTRGLSTTGRKAQLIERLRCDLVEDEEISPESEPEQSSAGDASSDSDVVPPRRKKRRRVAKADSGARAAPPATRRSRRLLARTSNAS